MGGGDLNLKKSWHPNTMKNQEKVWKAEQHKKDEDRKIEEMKKEIHEERMKDDLMSVAHKSGVITEKSDKMKWMYKSPAEQTSREEYLLGRKIDTNLQMMDEHEAAKENNEEASSKPVYVIEHEVAPESFLRRTEDFQVDLKRKILEDPLYHIRQKEKDANAAILSNPIKMKNIKKLLEDVMTDSSKKKKKKKKKSEKKKKRKKEKKKKKMEYSSNCSVEEEYSENEELKYKLSKKNKNKLALMEERHRQRRRSVERNYSDTHSSEKNHRKEKDRSRSSLKPYKHTLSEERSENRKRHYETSPIENDRSLKRNQFSKKSKKYSSKGDVEESQSDNSKGECNEYLFNRELKLPKHYSNSETKRERSKHERSRESSSVEHRRGSILSDEDGSEGLQLSPPYNKDRSMSKMKRKRRVSRSPSDNRQRTHKSNRDSKRSRLDSPEVDRSPIETKRKYVKSKIVQEISQSGRQLSLNRSYREDSLSDEHRRSLKKKEGSRSNRNEGMSSSKNISNRDRSGSMEERKYSRRHAVRQYSSSSSGEEKIKKPKLTTTQRTEEEMRRLRNMMMEAAKMRDKERKLNIEEGRKKETKELEEEKKAQGSLRTATYTSLSDTVESSIRSRAGKCQGKLDNNFLTR